jgi:DNA-directed RNA polymerase specialized sigma24 family protein
MRESNIESLPELPYVWDWPEAVPKNYDELAKMYGKYIAQQVQRYNKVRRNFEDLLQEIWMRLKASQLLERFAVKAAARLPARMTTLEVCSFLGVKFSTWRFYQWKSVKQRVTTDKYGNERRHERVWMPAPIEWKEGKKKSKSAGRYGADSVYTGESISYVLQAVLQDRHILTPTIRRERPPVSGHGFKTYLSQAIHNHFANWCRTRARKYQEQLLAPDTTLTKQSDGAYHWRTSKLDDPGSSWESSLTAAMEIDDEDLLDMARTIRKADIDVESDFGQKVVQTALALQRESRPSEERVQILELVCRGMTLKEALEQTVKVPSVMVVGRE